MFGVTFRLNAISGWITYTFQCWHFNGDPNLQRKCRLFSWNSCSFLKPSSSEQKCIMIKKSLNVFGFEDGPKLKVSKRWARKQCQLVVSQWWPCEEKIELLKPQKSNTFPVHRPQCSLNFDGDEDEEDEDEEYENRNIQTDRTSLMLEFDGDKDEDEDEYRIWGWEYPDRQTERACQRSLLFLSLSWISIFKHPPEFQKSSTMHKLNIQGILHILPTNQTIHYKQCQSKWTTQTELLSLNAMETTKNGNKALNTFIKSWFRIGQGWWEEAGVLAKSENTFLDNKSLCKKGIWMYLWD